jgi:organic radical activating enzyme
VARLDNESFLEYKKRVIDPVSKSFCAAKWLNATMWLDRGWTTSCHLPPHHQISRRAVQMDPSQLHNTGQKKAARKMMLNGERPKECDYCWKMEDMGRDAVSDRVFKTVIYPDSDIERISKLPHTANVALRTLEISFDRVCNFACSYCNSGFSTTWEKDIKRNGPYKLHSQGTETFKVDGSYGEIDPDNNPYIEAFWKWWPELSQSLHELRISGGEPLMSADVWRILDSFKADKLDHIRLAINSNLGARDELIDRLVKASRGVHDLDIYTSNESFGPHAEYIRDGLKYERWKSNMLKLKREGNFQVTHIMMTVNALSLFSMTDLFDDVLRWREELGPSIGRWSLNLLRFPSFMSPLVLPEHLKRERSNHLGEWLERNRGNPLMEEMEAAGIERLIHYLREVDRPHDKVSDIELQRSDFRSFYEQYDRRRGKNFRETFPSELVGWYDSLKVLEEPKSIMLKRRMWPLYAWYFAAKNAWQSY